MEVFESPKKIMALANHYCDGRFGRFANLGR
jgi:hypothetical protein